MSSPYPKNEKESEPKKSSWFASWFENDNSNIKQEIHRKLNEFDEYQKRYEQHNNPFFWGNHRQHPAAAAAASNFQQEMEEFLESAGFGGLQTPHQPWGTAGGGATSSSSSTFRTSNGHYQTMRKEDRNGVQIEVKFPRKIEPEAVNVEVLQEFPCVVQWRNHSGAAAAPAGDNKNREFRDRARLGESIDCSKLSASINSARNTLVVKAPTFASAHADNGQEKPRSVPVTERDE